MLTIALLDALGVQTCDPVQVAFLTQFGPQGPEGLQGVPGPGVPAAGQQAGYVLAIAGGVPAWAAPGQLIAPLWLTDANTVEQYNGANPQTFHLYNSNVGGNFQRLAATWAAGVATLKTEQGGTGVASDLALNAPNVRIGGALVASPVWTDGAAHTGVLVNATDTASAAGSLLADLQVGGVSKFSVRKDGAATVASKLSTPRVEFPGGVLTLGDAGGGNYAVLGTGLFAVTSAHGIAWAASTNANGGTWDLTLYRDAAGVLAQRNGTNAQEDRLYGTYTDSLNYQRLTRKFVSGGATPGFLITTEGAGTGAATDLVLNGGTGNTHVAGDFHVGRGSSNSQLLLRTLANNAASGSGVISFRTADNSSLSSVSFYTAGNAATLMGAPVASGLGIVSAGHIGIYTSGKDINLGGVSTTAPAWSFKAAGHLYAGGNNLYDIGDAAGTACPRSAYFGGSVFVLTDGKGFSLDPAAGTVYGMFRAGVDVQVHSGSYVSLMIGSTLALQATLNYNWLALPITGPSNIVEQRNGAAAQTFRVYNNFVDAANYDRAGITMAGNFAVFGTESAGTGVARHLALRSGVGASVYVGPGGGPDSWIFVNTGHLTTVTDNTVNIGAAASGRPASLFLGTSLYVNAAGSTGAGASAVFVRGPASDNAWGGGISLTSFNGTSVVCQILAANDGFRFAFNGTLLAQIGISGDVFGVRTVRTTNLTVATLPGAAAVGTGAAAFVTDSTVTHTAGVGAIVAGGGTNKVPVYSDGVNWRIG